MSGWHGVDPWSQSRMERLTSTLRFKKPTARDSLAARDESHRSIANRVMVFQDRGCKQIRPVYSSKGAADPLINDMETREVTPEDIGYRRYSEETMGNT